MKLGKLLVSCILTGAVLWGLNHQWGALPPIGTLLDPADGLYRTARQAVPPADTSQLTLGALDASVTIVRDDRGVPHIYAASDRDATIALGYVVAQDRLFQMDFISRVAAGRMATIFGAPAVETDRFLRRTGMEWGARKNLQRVEAEDGVEADLIAWYGAGVNAYLDALDPADLPLEFRLLGYRPDRYTPMHAQRVLQYMTFDLTYYTDRPEYALVRDRLGDTAFQTLYPNQPAGLYVPMIPSTEPSGATAAATEPSAGISEAAWTAAQSLLPETPPALHGLPDDLPHALDYGKGSNNWAVAGSRSATGAPLLANDMHLGLNLPPVWYEAHLVTPTMNMYGLTVPGAPVMVQGFNEQVGWGFTNTGADQIDHYALQLDAEGERYRYNGAYRDLRVEVDTIAVKGGPAVIDTLRYAHFGPVRIDRSDTTGALGAVATQWVGHKPSRTLRALWGMAHATDLSSFEAALQYWDAPMQNVLYAGTDGHIAIRSTGHLPVRNAGHGRGLLDGTSDAFAWTGRVPFDELPYARDPGQGYLTSSNQKPTGPAYPHYLGHDWRDGYRSIRLDSLLRRQPTHGIDDFKAYHADVNVVQQDVFVPLLAPLTELSARADTLRRLLQRWDGEAAVDRPEPLVMDVFLTTLRRMTWDEPVFNGVPTPEDAPFVALLRTSPNARWFDVQDTPETEDARALLRRALEATAATLEARHGWDRDAWRWGDHHTILFRHLTQVDVFEALGRGPYEYPGFAATVSPARGRTATHSASQRLIVDFSARPPRGYGVIPGGQSGDPLDPNFYDQQLPSYLDFAYYDLLRPAEPEGLPASRTHAKLTLVPGDS